MTTMSTILSPPLVVQQEGLSRGMTQSPPSTAELSEHKYSTAGWMTVGLMIRGASGSNLGELGSRSGAEIVGPGTLVEGTEYQEG